MDYLEKLIDNIAQFRKKKQVNNKWNKRTKRSLHDIMSSYLWSEMTQQVLRNYDDKIYNKKCFAKTYNLSGTNEPCPGLKNKTALSACRRGLIPIWDVLPAIKETRVTPRVSSRKFTSHEHVKKHPQSSYNSVQEKTTLNGMWTAISYY